MASSVSWSMVVYGYGVFACIKWVRAGEQVHRKHTQGRGGRETREGAQRTMDLSSSVSALALALALVALAFSMPPRAASMPHLRHFHQCGWRASARCCRRHPLCCSSARLSRCHWHLQQQQQLSSFSGPSLVLPSCGWTEFVQTTETETQLLALGQPRGNCPLRSAPG